MTLPIADLLARVELPDRARWTRDSSPQLGAPMRIVVVPPDGDPERGERVARKLAIRGRVRLVARGATRPNALDGIVRTELDAYLPNDKTPLLASLRAPVERWISRTFEGALLDEPAVPAFYASAMARVLRAHVHAAPLALGLAVGEGDHEVFVSEPWEGVPLLRDAAKHTGARVRAPDSRVLLFGLALSGHACAAAGLGAARRLIEFRRQGGARQRLDELRRRSTGTPDAWITVTGHWPHSCRHVIEPIGRAARARGKKLGVLLQYALEPGALGGGLRERKSDAAMFPALEQPALADVVVAVDQIASAESWTELARVIGRASVASARIVARLVRSGARPDLEGWPVDLSRDVTGLAQLATIDVLRAEEARRASRKLVERRAMRGTAVAFSHASLAQVAVPEQVLQRAGARTMDLVHGALAEALDMMTSARTWTGSKVFWTEEEVRYTAGLLTPQRCVGGRPSRTLATRPERPRSGPARVLALTNYGTRTGDRLRLLPRVAYQDAFFEALSVIRRIAPDAHVRWRPHPGDDPAAIEATLRANATLGLEQSIAESLDDDLAWADVVVTSISSTIVEACMHPTPILVHAIPVHEADVILAMFDPIRLFHDALSCERALRDALARGAGEPESALRRRFFGPSGEPSELADLVLGRSQEEAQPNDSETPA